MGAMHCKNKFVKGAVIYDSPSLEWWRKEYFTTLIQKSKIFPFKALLSHYSWHILQGNATNYYWAWFFHNFPLLYITLSNLVRKESFLRIYETVTYSSYEASRGFTSYEVLCELFELHVWPQCAKKVVSESPGLVDFAFGLVNSVFNLPGRQVMFFEEFE